MERDDRGEAMLTLSQLPLEKSLESSKNERMNHCFPTATSKTHFSDTHGEKQNQKCLNILQSMGIVAWLYGHSFFA